MAQPANKNKQNTATLTLPDGTTKELPVYKGTEGPDVIDVTKLYGETGYFTYDPGFASTGSCESKITFIDGEKGILRYRGYDIADLADNCTFMETAYLLLYGKLPNPKKKGEFENMITYHTMVHEQLHYFYRGFRRDAHPMAVMVGVVGALSSFYHDSLDIQNPEHREISTHRLIAKMGTLAAMTMKYTMGQPFIYPRNDLTYTENFLHMCFAVPSEPYVINPVVVDAMRRLFILHADHEQNASTSTVRLAGSSGANPFACIASGISSLWGPAHGGANEAVLSMLDEIGSVKNVKKYIDKAKDKNDPFRLMGFGHRVYKNHDPRASVIKTACDNVLKELGVSDPRLELAMELERIALEDEYFIEKKLYPNVDFYSGIIYSAIGFPTSTFTVLFALARTVGWLAQWREMIENPAHRIGRPRQLYTGEQRLDFQPLGKRK